MVRKLAAGNWKMNGLGANIAELEALVAAPAPECDVLICPPATLMGACVKAAQGKIAIGGQDCHSATSGAHTGDISAQMIHDAGGSYVIVGHSERRTDHNESDADVSAKAKAAIEAGLTAIICLGETEAQRDAGETLDVIGAQLAGSLPEGATAENAVIAYEPIWAIGTGRTPTLEQITEVHDSLRADLCARLGNQGQDMRLLYGGSVKPANAAEIFAIGNVNGALVGGASLKAKDFGDIITALSES
ncbi:triose-phosphate isomerase [Rhodobacteraceae bacterium]|nr:triose-phosphate isomerase [Paracoccaceae bacterium]